MSDIQTSLDIETSIGIPHEVERAFQPIADAEAVKLLSCVGDKLVRREHMFLDHLDEGQNTWAKPNPSYSRWKQKRTGSTEQGVLTGELKASLKGEGKSLYTRTSGKKRLLVIGLKLVKKGTNVYNIFQRGLLHGLQMGNRFLSKSDISKAHADNLSRWSAGAEHGESISRWSKRTGYTNALTKQAGESVSRVSQNARPVTFIADGDPEIIERVLVEELNITATTRGLA